MTRYGNFGARRAKGALSDCSHGWRSWAARDALSPRKSNGRAMSWRSVCFDDARTKMGRGYFEPRTALVDSVLEDAKRFERATSPLVFPGQRGTPISGFTRLVGR